MAQGPECRRYNILSALFVFAVSLVVYLTTVAPSVALWDCGEYIAAGHSLGIPHPPGNPLFVLMMRVASMFFGFFEDIGYRMNFAVAIFSAVTAAVIYLVVVEAGKIIIGVPDTIYKKVALSVGGVVGGLFTAFGYTFWFSAVEMSVYNISMLNIAVCTLLMLLWAQSKKPDRDKLLVLVAFLGFLGIGLHMFTMIIFPSAFLFMVLWDEKKRYDWRLWFTGIAMAAIIYSLSTFLWLGPLTLVITLIMSVSSQDHKKEWRLCFFFALFAIVGYSVHAFIPIRSALEPMLNENHPATWEAFIGFLERKQYGSESMISRMFHRRGEWGSQFGIEGHMGFGGFHLTQFFRFGEADTQQSFFRDGFVSGMAKLVLYLIPTAFMLYGWFYMWKRNTAAAIFLITLTLVTTIGMVFYMNFADGNRPERYDYEQWMRAGQPGPMPTVHREVRVRDYFFTAGFMYFGMWIGMAACCLLHALYSAKETGVKMIAPAVAVILAVSPIIPAWANYNLSTRTGDWVAYDSAYNMLNNCEPNGILFTAGDNDTFPLWALQEAYGIRTDVRIVNLSLVNTGWYIKQLKKLEPRVPISLTEEEIDVLEPRLNPFSEPRMHTLKNANLTFMLPGIQRQRVLRVQDRMVLNIVDATAWSKPVYFAMTVSESDMMGLSPFLRSEGLVYRLMPQKVTPGNHYNLDRAIHMIDSVYLLRGLGQAKNNNTSRSYLTNYLQIALDMRGPMEDLRKKGGSGYSEKKASVLRFMDRCVEIMPWNWHIRMVRHEFYMDNGMPEEARLAMEKAIAEDPVNADHYRSMLTQATRALERRGAVEPQQPSEPTQAQLLERLQEAMEQAQDSGSY